MESRDDDIFTMRAVAVSVRVRTLRQWASTAEAKQGTDDVSQDRNCVMTALVPAIASSAAISKPSVPASAQYLQDRHDATNTNGF
jgi:hypothetical protein